ncbi:hypothetical protein M885DRAFT_522495 [Pelagophyceae sp. CCMP2097]|nr:hypothetical protein M885DRAFT_522495 [Pelagophyceae sp. CCMP2097]
MQRSISGDFDAAAAAVLAWGSREASTNVKCFVARDTASKQMATCAQTYIPQVWCVNPVFQTYSVAQRLTRRHKVRSDWAALPFGATRIAAVAYTTQQGHLLAGEERLSVAQGPDGTLHIQVLSVSKGAGLRGRLVYPFIGPMQQSFFREQLDVVSEAAARKL